MPKTMPREKTHSTLPKNRACYRAASYQSRQRTVPANEPGETNRQFAERMNRMRGVKPRELVVIDEAADVKEWP